MPLATLDTLNSPTTAHLFSTRSCQVFGQNTFLLQFIYASHETVFLSVLNSLPFNVVEYPLAFVLWDKGDRTFATPFVIHVLGISPALAFS